MLSKILKSSAPILLASLLSIPAAAQIPVPNLEIHITHSRPPRLRHERIPRRPGDGYVWVGGYWGWQGSRWMWTPGRWDRPAETGVTWVTPRYQRDSGYYRYEPGHWSNQTVVEGEDYRGWKEKHHHHDRDHERQDR
ncbi:MAG: YXWGXW repeat-containing protein [Thermoanaerobaculia bacterium]